MGRVYSAMRGTSMSSMRSTNSRWRLCTYGRASPFLTDTKGETGAGPSDWKSELGLIRWIIWSSIEVHLVDALAAEGDEGRCSLR